MKAGRDGKGTVGGLFALSRITPLWIMIFTVLGTASLQAKEMVGETAVTRIESPHPYPPGGPVLPAVWTQTLHHDGATFIKLHFAQFALGPGDFLQLWDGRGHLVAQYTEQQNARPSFWAPAVDGDTLRLELHADADGEGEGILIDRYGHGGGVLMLESLCGGNGQKEDVACHAGTPLADASRAVGRMLFEEHGVFYACTGFLVSQMDHFMSNEHCIASQDAVDSLEVTFGYERTSCGGTTFTDGETFMGDRLLFADAKLDVALMTLQGQPSARYAFLPLSAREPQAGEALFLPQHPGGSFKQVSVTDCQVGTPMMDGDAPGSDFGHLCDTEHGSSGSPVLDQDLNVIGLHHLGGCGASGGENQAVLISRILPILPALGPDLALTRITAPRLITLKNGQAKMAAVKVQLQNRGAREETIPDAGTLTQLLHLAVESLGGCPAPVAALRADTPRRTFPLILRPKQRLDLVFDVSFSCVNSTTQPDYRYAAVVDYTALGGEADSRPRNDQCPREAVSSSAPQRQWQDKGCGGKKTDGTFGADVLTDVVVK